MIEALRQPITREMIAQEINRYADGEWRYADSSDETAIEEAVRNMERMAEAQKRYRGEGDSDHRRSSARLCRAKNRRCPLSHPDAKVTA